MPVTVGATPTELNFNATTPAIPSGKLAVTVQVGSPYPDPNVPGAVVRDASMYVDSASGPGSTHAEPLCDGLGNFIFDDNNDVICVTGVPN